MYTPSDKDANPEAMAKMLDGRAQTPAGTIHLVNTKGSSVTLLRKSFSAGDAMRFTPSRQQVEAKQMNELEAAGHFLKLLQAKMPEPGERKIVSVLRHEFAKMSFSVEDFEEGIALAVESGWVTRSGMMVELTKAGRAAVV